MAPFPINLSYYRFNLAQCYVPQMGRHLVEFIDSLIWLPYYHIAFMVILFCLSFAGRIGIVCVYNGIHVHVNIELVAINFVIRVHPESHHCKVCIHILLTPNYTLSEAYSAICKLMSTHYVQYNFVRAAR